MKSIIAFPLLAAAVIASHASAATLSFDPPVAVVSAGETADFLVSITSTDFQVFSAVDIFFTEDVGTPANLTPNLSFSLDPDFLPPLPDPWGPPLPWCELPICMLYVGGFNPFMWMVTDESPLVVGTLSVDTTYLANGSYDIIVDPNIGPSAGFDPPFSIIHALGAQGVLQEDLSGQATVIVPEPATISLLGLTAVCVIRRRCVPRRDREGADRS